MQEQKGGAIITAHPLELRERGFQLYKERKTLPEIGAALGVPAPTIAGWSSRGKWKARLASFEAGTSDVLPLEESKATEARDALTFSEKQARFRDKAASLALKGVEEASKLAPGELVRQADKVANLVKMGQKALDLEKSSPSVIVNVGLLSRANEGRTIEAVLLPDCQQLATTEPLTIGEATGLEPVAPGD